MFQQRINYTFYCTCVNIEQYLQLNWPSLHQTIYLPGIQSVMNIMRVPTSGYVILSDDIMECFPITSCIIKFVSIQVSFRRFYRYLFWNRMFIHPICLSESLIKLIIVAIILKLWQAYIFLYCCKYKNSVLWIRIIISIKSLISSQLIRYVISYSNS